jgi:DNA polymerase-3 subunit epsilon
MAWSGFNRSLDSAVSPWPERLAQLAGKARDPRLRSFYEAGCVSPETPLKDVPLVALDFETTGLDPVSHAIVSLGLVPFSIYRVRCREARHWIVQPRLPLHRKSITIHGITHTDVDQAPDLDEILDEVLAALAGCIVVVHYRGIERPFLDRALKARLGEGIEFPVIDTMAIEARLHPNRNRNWFGRILGKPPVSIRLADSRTRYGLPHYPPHHALTDALASAELLQAQVQYHFSPRTTVGELWY